MKKIIYLVLIILISVGSVSADPFLICDPQAGVETYEAYRDGELMEADIPPEPDGSMRYDLEGIDPGAYSFTAKACVGDWGCSELSDPYLSNTPMSKPTGIAIAR